MLARRVGEIEVTCNAMQAKNATLVAEVQQLRSIIEMMAGDSSALAAQVGARRTQWWCGTPVVSLAVRVRCRRRHYTSAAEAGVTVYHVPHQYLLLCVCVCAGW